VTAPWIDSHCHLDMAPDGPDAAVDGARAAGVTRMVTIGVDLASSEAVIGLARRLSGVRATVGVHPNEATGYDAGTEARIARLAAAAEVVGIGEAGLDHYRQGASPEDQERSFRSQIGVAKRLGKALVVHTRDAHDDTKRVLADEGPPERLVMHCFSGDGADAADYLALGAVLSFAGTVTFKNARPVQEAAAACPLDRMLVETDSPFLSPHPFRGTPNSPARIPVIGAFLAEMKGVEADTLAGAVAATADWVWQGNDW